MSDKIGVGDYVTPKNGYSWSNVYDDSDVIPGPQFGSVYRVDGAEKIGGQWYLGLESFPSECYNASCFRKVLPQGLTEWLDEVNMNPTVKVSEPA
jgi:hypothetical protein